MSQEAVVNIQEDGRESGTVWMLDASRFGDRVFMGDVALLKDWSR